LRVLLATDRPDFAEALSLFLAESQIRVVDVVYDADRLLAQAASVHPDVILVDERLGAIVSTRAIADLKRRGDLTPVVLMSTSQESDPARTAGAAAHATLGDPPQSLLTALNDAVRATN